MRVIRAAVGLIGRLWASLLLLTLLLLLLLTGLLLLLLLLRGAACLPRRWGRLTCPDARRATRRRRRRRSDVIGFLLITFFVLCDKGRFKASESDDICSSTRKLKSEAGWCPCYDLIRPFIWSRE